VWVPGDRWAASWVAFRYSDRAIGWAPLPPDTLQVTGSVRIDEVILTANYYQPRWVFVEPRYFADVRLVSYVVPPERNVTFIRETRNVTNITVQNNVFVNRSFEPQRIRAVIGREVPTVRVQRVDSVNRINVQQNQQTQINTINIYNPQVRVSRDQAPPERARARESDRPRVSVRPEYVRPEERRDRAKPSAPPSTQERDRGRQPGQRDQDDKRGATPAQPAQPPKAAPGAPPSRATPEERRGATPAQPAQPPKAAPGAPPSRGTQEERRGATPATPAQPPKAAPGAPPPRGTQEERRGATPATPAQPPKVAPGAPPSRGQPQDQQQQKKQEKPSAPGKSDDKKKEDGPSR
jgi:hypothetical protein